MPGPRLQFLSKYQSGVRHDPEIQASRHPPKQSSSGPRNPSSGPLCLARHRPPDAPVLPTSVHEAATTAPGQETRQPEAAPRAVPQHSGSPGSCGVWVTLKASHLSPHRLGRRTLSCPQNTASPACSAASRASSLATPQGSKAPSALTAFPLPGAPILTLGLGTVRPDAQLCNREPHKG